MMLPTMMLGWYHSPVDSFDIYVCVMGQEHSFQQPATNSGAQLHLYGNSHEFSSPYHCHSSREVY